MYSSFLSNTNNNNKKRTNIFDDKGFRSLKRSGTLRQRPSHQRYLSASDTIPILITVYDRRGPDDDDVTPPLPPPRLLPADLLSLAKFFKSTRSDEHVTQTRLYTNTRGPHARLANLNYISQSRDMRRQDRRVLKVLKKPSRGSHRPAHLTPKICQIDCIIADRKMIRPRRENRRKVNVSIKTSPLVRDIYIYIYIFLILLAGVPLHNDRWTAGGDIYVLFGFRLIKRKRFTSCNRRQVMESLINICIYIYIFFFFFSFSAGNAKAVDTTLRPTQCDFLVGGRVYRQVLTGEKRRGDAWLTRRSKIYAKKKRQKKKKKKKEKRKKIIKKKRKKEKKKLLDIATCRSYFASRGQQFAERKRRSSYRRALV
ncbi:hypothetical protein PUN28_018285 [Cardiocondyla obscurior]|uniref:Uncharacterized protein n=1 Tax=Cardiocondyla obscurior TaxID=286306 RepID=A0AAW2EJG1_9HYME